MTTLVMLVIISFYGGIETIQMRSLETCAQAAKQFNDRGLGGNARAYCIVQ